MTRDFIFPMKLPRCPCLIPIKKNQQNLRKKLGQRIERYFWDKKENLLAIEKKAQELKERLFLYRQILTSEPQCFLLDQKENFFGEKFLIFKDTKNIVLSSQWLQQNIVTMENWSGRQTDYGKTTFIQNIGKNNIFAELRRYFGYQKYLFLQKEKNICRLVLKKQ